MSLNLEAAKYLRMVWQGHDELNKGLCSDGAFGLYAILTRYGPDKLSEAADLVQEAFWLADDAESYQEKDDVKENEFYNQAGNCLRQSRRLVGLEIESVDYTIAWWKAYRHKDKKSLFENLVQEHQIQLKNKDDVLANQCALLLLEAAAEHKEKNWDAVDNKLEEYFEIYLPNVL